MDKIEHDYLNKQLEAQERYEMAGRSLSFPEGAGLVIAILLAALAGALVWWFH